MRKAFKRILIVGCIIFLAIQFYQPARNTDNGQVLLTHITKIYNVPDSINSILKTSCYDCHSNNSNYLWYDNIQPARMLVENHIKNGKKNLNFSEWGNYSSRKQQSKLERIIKQIKANEMPLSSYTILHKNAILSAKQKEMMIKWIENILQNND